VEDGTAAFLFKVYRTLKQTMTEGNSWGTFQKAGLGFETNHEPCRLCFNEGKLRRSPGFDEISALDFRFEELSIRRQRAGVGWISI
jgi:hypothetical protein